MDLLKTFYNDVHTREALKEFQIAMLKELAIERVFNKEDVSGLNEAMLVVKKSFSRLEELYGEKKTVVQDSPR